MSIDRLLDIARGAVGLTQDDTAFQALCGPGERPERARDLATLSTCALFLRGCFATVLAEQDTCSGCGNVDRAGCNCCLGKPPCVPERLWAPYRIGMAMADLVASILVSNHVRMAQNYRPCALVIVGDPGHEHVYLVESIERDGWPDGSIELTAIEAGQVDHRGRQCVRRKRHEISADGVDHTWRWPLPADMPATDTIPLPRTSACPIIARPVTWILDPRPLLEGT